LQGEQLATAATNIQRILNECDIELSNSIHAPAILQSDAHIKSVVNTLFFNRTQRGSRVNFRKRVAHTIHIQCNVAHCGGI
jgi:hypothetical protein